MLARKKALLYGDVAIQVYSVYRALPKVLLGIGSAAADDLWHVGGLEDMPRTIGWLLRRYLAFCNITRLTDLGGFEESHLGVCSLSHPGTAQIQHLLNGE
jgi:hypothetical protein